MKLSERDQRILNHVARYHLTFHEVVSWLFFDGGDPRRTLNRLEKARLLAKIDSFNSSRKAFRLDRAASAFVDVSRRQLETPRPTSLHFNLAVYAFCLLSGRARVRLLPKELRDLYGDIPPGKCHVIEERPKETRVMEVMVPGLKATDAKVVSAITESVTKALEAPFLEGFIRSRLYGHVILVDNADRQDLIQRRIDAAKGPQRRPLGQWAYILVEVVPGVGDLTEAFDALGPQKGKKNEAGRREEQTDS